MCGGKRLGLGEGAMCGRSANEEDEAGRARLLVKKDKDVLPTSQSRFKNETRFSS
jgi:hypothetical protein